MFKLCINLADKLFFCQIVAQNHQGKRNRIEYQGCLFSPPFFRLNARKDFFPRRSNERKIIAFFGSLSRDGPISTFYAHFFYVHTFGIPILSHVRPLFPHKNLGKKIFGIVLYVDSPSAQKMLGKERERGGLSENDSFLTDFHFAIGGPTPTFPSKKREKRGPPPEIIKYPPFPLPAEKKGVLLKQHQPVAFKNGTPAIFFLPLVA